MQKQKIWILSMQPVDGDYFFIAECKKPNMQALTELMMRLHVHVHVASLARCS